MVSFISIVTIVLKELRELFSRPWQALTLIVGPLVLMVCFGIGANTAAKPPRTIIVLPPGQPKPELLRDYQRQFEQFLDIREYSDNEEAARAELQRGAVDAIVILPLSPFETVASGRQATIQVLYKQIDPIWRWVVPTFTQVMASDINREIFVQTLGQQQSTIDSADRNIKEMLRLLDLAVKAADTGDRFEAEQRLSDAVQQSDEIDEQLRQIGPDAGQLRANVQQVRDLLRAAEQEVALTANPTAPAGQPLREQLGLIEATRRVQQLQTTLNLFTSVPADVVISPLTVDTRNVARLEPDIITFYAPSILALLIQHIAVSMGSLALVRERLSGSFDLYMIAPIGRVQLLLGKYAAYMLFTLVIAAVVLVAMLVGLHIPVLGNPWQLLLALLLLVVASVGLGLAFSLLATSDRQAVQFSMLALLGVVFFSGFTLPLSLLRPLARGFSYALPATYGIGLFQSIMLQGATDNTLFLLVLAGISALLFVCCLGLLHWRTRAA